MNTITLGIHRPPSAPCSFDVQFAHEEEPRHFIQFWSEGDECTYAERAAYNEYQMKEWRLKQAHRTIGELTMQLVSLKSKLESTEAKLATANDRL